jgi:hypothetical protein
MLDTWELAHGLDPAIDDSVSGVRCFIATSSHYFRSEKENYGGVE